MLARRDAMMDGRDKIGVRQRFALVIRNGNQWHFAEPGIKRLEIPQILAAVKGSQGPRRQRAEEREMEQIDVKMKNVKLVRALTHLINHQHKVGYDVVHGRIKAQGASATGSYIGAGDRVSACK